MGINPSNTVISQPRQRASLPGKARVGSQGQLCGGSSNRSSCPQAAHLGAAGRRPYRSKYTRQRWHTAPSRPLASGAADWAGGGRGWVGRTMVHNFLNLLILIVYDHRTVLAARRNRPTRCNWNATATRNSQPPLGTQAVTLHGNWCRTCVPPLCLSGAASGVGARTLHAARWGDPPPAHAETGQGLRARSISAGLGGWQVQVQPPALP